MPDAPMVEPKHYHAVMAAVEVLRRDPLAVSPDLWPHLAKDVEAAAKIIEGILPPGTIKHHA